MATNMRIPSSKRIRDILQIPIDRYPASRSSCGLNSYMECDKTTRNSKTRQCYDQNVDHELEHSEHVRSSIEKYRYFKLFHDGGPYHIETSPLIYYVNHLPLSFTTM